MRKHTLYTALLPVLALCLLLTACAPAGGAEGSKDPVPEIPNSVSEEAEAEDMEPPRQPEEDAIPETPAPDAPDSDAACWQEAYIAVLDAIRAQNNGGHFGLDESAYTDNDASFYQLYDIDKDGIPELLVEYGILDMGRRVQIYTIRDGEAKYVQEMSVGHGSLYTWPDANGVLFYYGHMGSAGANRWTLENGRMVSENLFDEYVEAGEEYTDLQTIAPGTRPVDSFTIGLDLPVLCYQQIRMDMENRIPVVSVQADNEAVKKQLLDVMENNGMIHGAAADFLSTGIGYMSFQDYLGPGMVDEYSDYPLEIDGYAWADVNGDGQTECILHLVRNEQEDYFSELYAVLSLQADEVYAYSLHYFYGVVLEDGVFAAPGGAFFRLLFDGGACFQYSVEPSSDAGEVIWEK